MQPDMRPITQWDQWFYENTVLNALEILYHSDTYETVMRILRGKRSDPVRAIVSVARFVLPATPSGIVPPLAYWIPIVADVVRLAAESRTFDADINTAQLAIEQLLNEPSIQEI